MSRDNDYDGLPKRAILCTCGQPVGDSLMRCAVCRAPLCLQCGWPNGSVCTIRHAAEAFTIDRKYLM